MIERWFGVNRRISSFTALHHIRKHVVKQQIINSDNQKRTYRPLEAERLKTR